MTRTWMPCKQLTMPPAGEGRVEFGRLDTVLLYIPVVGSSRTNPSNAPLHLGMVKCQTYPVK